MNSEQIIPPELSTNPKTEVATKSHEFSSPQIVKNTASVSTRAVHLSPMKESSIKGSAYLTQYDTTTDQDMPLAQPSSGEPTYSCWKHVPASCDTTGAGEWESQYSKLSHDNMETDPTSKEH